MKCVIFGGASIHNYDSVRRNMPDSPRFVIAADRGFIHCLELGISPDLLIGDFDSLGSDFVNKIREDIPEIISAPADKDDTDTLLAVKYAAGKNISRDFIFFGGIGGRLGHTFANVQTLSYLSANGMNGVFVGDDVTIRNLVPGNGRQTFENSGDTEYISIFSLSEEAEMIIDGLKYSGSIRLRRNFPLGVSNATSGGKIWSIEVLSGEILIIEEKK